MPPPSGPGCWPKGPISRTRGNGPLLLIGRLPACMNASDAGDDSDALSPIAERVGHASVPRARRCPWLWAPPTANELVILTHPRVLPEGSSLTWLGPEFIGVVVCSGPDRWNRSPVAAGTSPAKACTRRPRSAGRALPKVRRGPPPPARRREPRGRAADIRSWLRAAGRPGAVKASPKSCIASRSLPVWFVIPGGGLHVPGIRSGPESPPFRVRVGCLIVLCHRI